MSVFRAIMFGYRWLVGNGKKIQFWENRWSGTSPLAVQFWPLYSICNESSKTIREVWEEDEVKLTFRRIFNDEMMEQWNSQYYQKLDDPILGASETTIEGVFPLPGWTSEETTTAHEWLNLTILPSSRDRLKISDWDPTSSTPGKKVEGTTVILYTYCTRCLLVAPTIICTYDEG